MSLGNNNQDETIFLSLEGILTITLIGLYLFLYIRYTPTVLCIIYPIEITYILFFSITTLLALSNTYNITIYLWKFSKIVSNMFILRIINFVISLTLTLIYLIWHSKGCGNLRTIQLLLVKLIPFCIGSLFPILLLLLIKEILAHKNKT
ncbi:MAG: hypothetical protein K9W46_09145 [Candidatus Heimdallarchaeum endolithica]|uniref:Uncharacterized protein n=1 Tax=Candidatus Heimdallarchaeum endolithica TaxID=2876572 RepID=A0A9Y1FN54_9ARCH|nr:MAG: hypothetical protein K9W46_09145 [Candidatus Heimdallarchaeum endolithica]